MKWTFKQANLIPLLLVVYITKNFFRPDLFFDFGVISVLIGALLFKIKLDKETLNREDEIFEKLSKFEKDIVSIKTAYDTEAKSLNDKISGINLMYQQASNKQKENVFGGWHNK